MAKTYDNELSGVLFKNDKKATPKHPDYRGEAQIEGTAYWLSAWVKEAKDGRKYLSLAFTVKEGQEHPARGGRDDDSDVPF